MANHKSSLKRIRQAEKRRLENRYWAKTARNAVRQRLGRKNIISKNKASNLCSGLSNYINKL